ncbi:MULTISPECIES: protein tyrosine phosphatase [unclassified Frankia]|nr:MULTISPECIES: protein tyrosine phosphatase [unclassified Frankia]
MRSGATPIAPPPSAVPAPWHVLMVCKGNLCRSPTAEYVAAAALRAGLGAERDSVTVSSAGTHARAYAPMHPHTATVLAERGLNPAGFRAHRIDVDTVRSAGLVLCAERKHRGIVVTMVPKAVRRTFTLREFARLTAGITLADIVSTGLPSDGDAAGSLPAYGDALVALAVGRRGLTRPERPTDDDIADPIGASIEAFRYCAEQISAALARPLGLLTLAARMTG